MTPTTERRHALRAARSREEGLEDLADLLSNLRREMAMTDGLDAGERRVFVTALDNFDGHVMARLDEARAQAAREEDRLYGTDDASMRAWHFGRAI